MHTTTHSLPTVPATAMVTHRSHYTRAMMFIQSHGHFAAITKDGLLAMSWEGRPYAADREGIDPADGWYEAPELFDVDDDGMVSSRAVRLWLGY